MIHVRYILNASNVTLRELGRTTRQAVTSRSVSSVCIWRQRYLNTSAILACVVMVTHTGLVVLASEHSFVFFNLFCTQKLM